MRNDFRRLLKSCSFVLVFVWACQTAQAGFLDKLNQAAQAVQQVQSAGQTAGQVGSAMKRRGGSNNSQGGSQQNQFELTKTDNPIKGTWGNQVTCAGPNSATCQNGMDNIVNCMYQGHGYYYRLVTDRLEDKLKNGGFSKDDQKLLKQDIASTRDAIETTQVVDPDPNEKQRWMSWLTDEELQDITRLNSKYMNEVRQDCDDRFGGMARYSSGN